MGTVMRGFQVGDSPGPGPSRKNTVALNASARTVSAGGGMQCARPGLGPRTWGVGSPSPARAARRYTANARRARPARRRRGGRRGLVHGEAAEPAGSGAGGRATTGARDHGEPGSQQLVAAGGVPSVGRATRSAIIVPDEVSAVPQVDAGVRDRAGKGTEAERGQGYSVVQARVAVEGRVDRGRVGPAAGACGIDDFTFVDRGT
jgi:hypothetical protein